jgi:hypothetical protein
VAAGVNLGDRPAGLMLSVCCGVPHPGTTPARYELDESQLAHSGQSTHRRERASRRTRPSLLLESPALGIAGPLNDFAEGSWSVWHCGDDLFLGERQGPHADSERVVEGVTDGGRGGPLRGLADS